MNADDRIEKIRGPIEFIRNYATRPDVPPFIAPEINRLADRAEQALAEIQDELAAAFSARKEHE